MEKKISVYEALFNELVKKNIVENEDPEHISAVKPRFVNFITDEFENGYFHDLTDFLAARIQPDKKDKEKWLIGKKMMLYVKNYFQVYAYLSGSKKITYWNVSKGENKTNFINSLELLPAMQGNSNYASDEALMKLINKMGNHDRIDNALPNGNPFMSYKKTLNHLGKTKEIEDIFGVKIDYNTFILKKEVTASFKSADFD